MKINKQQLIEMNACADGLKRFISQTNNTDESVDVLSLIGGKNTIDDLIWLAGKTLSKDKIVRFACDCALINIELIRPYTDKYYQIVEFLQNPDSANAYAAAEAADDAAYAADDAVEAAYDAAYAADDAAYAAADAAYAAYAAVAAANAAYEATQEKINELLKQLFS
jgi:hypothetical protein